MPIGLRFHCFELGDILVADCSFARDFLIDGILFEGVAVGHLECRLSD